MNILIDPLAHPVVGHRGMAAAAPENTIEAMALAFSYGADAVEFDLRVTADGEVVVIHDARVDRTTDGTGEVAALPLAELRELNAGARFRAGAVEDRAPPPAMDSSGKLFPEYARTRAGTGRHYVVPTFQEVLERFPDKHLLIEIKTPEASQPARALIERFGAENRCLVDSYSESSLLPFRGSKIPAGAGKEGIARLLTAFFTLRNAEVSFEGMCVPTRFGMIPLPLWALVRIARKRHKTLHFWTINDPMEASRLWRAGANGIVTDDVRPILAQRFPG